MLNSNPAPIVIPCVEVASGIGFTTNKSFCDEYRSKNDNVNIAFYGGNSSGTGKANFMTYRRTYEDVLFYRNVDINSGYKIQSNIYNSNGHVNVAFQNNSVDYLTWKNDKVECKKTLLIAGRDGKADMIYMKV